MKYEKPNVVLVDAAIGAVQSHVFKTFAIIPDLLTLIFDSSPAYEADE